MPIRFVVGLPGTGKTAWCHDAIRAENARHVEGPMLGLLVPEQASWQNERALLTGSLAASIRLRVLSFERLAQWVFTTIGRGPRLRLNDLHRRVLVTAIIARLRREDPASSGGILAVRSVERAVANFLAEMKLFRVPPAEIEQQAARVEQSDPALARKLRDLARVAAEMERRIAGRFEDPQDTLASLREVLATLPQLEGAQIYIDGFYGFTPTEMEILRGLARRTSRLTITLGMEPETFRALRAGQPPRESRRTFWIEETLQDLLALIADDGIEVEEPVFLPRAQSPAARHESPAMVFVREHFLASPLPPRASPPDHAGAIALEEVASPREEARRAAEVLRLWHVEQGWRWGEMAVLTRRMADNVQPLVEAFRAFRIPVFLDRQEPLETHPVVQGTTAALRAVLGDGEPADLLAFAKSGLFAFDADAVARVESFVTVWPRTMGQWFGGAAWESPAPRSAFEDDAPREIDDESLARIDATRAEIVAPLRDLRETLRATADEAGHQAMEPFCRALGLFLHRALPEPDDFNADVLHQVGNLLGHLVEAAGDERFPAAVLQELVSETFAGLSLPRVPPTLDQVIVGEAERTRLPRIKGLVIIGLSDGMFPSPGTNRTLLSDAERDRLAAELGGKALRGRSLRPSTRRLFLRENTLALQTFCAPSHRLHGLRPQSGEAGDKIGPSPYWKDLQRLFPTIEVQRAPEVHGADLAGALSRTARPREVASVAGRMVLGTDAFRPQAPPEVAEHVAQLAGRAADEARRVIEYACDRNTATLSPTTMQSMIGDRLHASVTALQSYAACPFQYFAQRLLRPEAPMPSTAAAADLGNVAHAALKSLADALRAHDQGWADIDPELASDLVETHIARPIERLRSAGLFQQASESLLLESLREQLTDLVRFHIEAARVTRARTIMAEASFGSHDAPLAGPTYSVTTADGHTVEVLFRGQIDRIDEWTTDTGITRLAVIDYKSSDMKIAWQRAPHGLAMQLPMYLAVVEANAATLGGHEPVGAFYSAVRMNASAARKLHGIGAYARADEHGLVAEKLVSHGAKSVETKTAGSGDLVASTQFAQLGPALEKQVAELVRRLMAGDVEVRPFDDRGNRPCTWCDYRPSCRVDFAMNRAFPIPAAKRKSAVRTWLGPAAPGDDEA